MLGRAAGVALVLLLACPLGARAQGDALPRLAPDRPLTLRPTARTRALAERVERILALRLDVPVAVGEDAPPEVLEAVPEGHMALDRIDGEILLVLAGPEGQVFRSEVPLAGGRRGRARAVALAVEALRDAALDGPPEGSASQRSYPHDGQQVLWIYREREGGLFGPRRPREALAKPTINIGFLMGLSTERETLILGPRIGLGLCLDTSCVVLEGDLPVLPEESASCDGRRIEYRPINLALRLQLRPIVIDDVSFAFDFGILSRFGLANLVGLDVSRVATDFGIRGGIEGAWRFAAPFELVLEIGADVHTSPAVFIRSTRPPPGMPEVCASAVERVLVEDLVTVWGTLGIRLRP
ncbi:MAG: hypothetical protein VYE22_41520 [Myxococcota bacterium]|nr:hypothetical protein [Myxococcota bacterium]